MLQGDLSSNIQTHCMRLTTPPPQQLTSSGSANCVAMKLLPLRMPVVRLEVSLRTCSGCTSAGTAPAHSSSTHQQHKSAQ
jgi:hypothetical protein